MAASLRRTRPDNDPYETWVNPQIGWKWHVLKFYQSRENTIDNDYGRVFCLVEGDFTEKGDTYYHEIMQNAVLVHTNYGE